MPTRFESFLQEFLSNFSGLEIIDYDDAYDKFLNEEAKGNLNTLFEGPNLSGRHLIYFNSNNLFQRTGILSFSIHKNKIGVAQRRSATLDIEQNYSKFLPSNVQHGAEVILSVDYKEKTITVNKIRIPIKIKFTEFDFLNCVCNPNSKFTLPTNAETFIMGIQ